MKKTTVIFSFILITVFSVGNFLLHLVYLENYKEDFKEYIIKHKKEVVLTNIEIKANEMYVNSASISWEDDNHEIVYHDNLYDIIAIEYHANKVIVTVASDEQEMSLKKEFASLYDINSHNKTKSPFELLKNFFSLKFLANCMPFQFNNVEDICSANVISQVFQISTMVIHLETPPPDLFS